MSVEQPSQTIIIRGDIQHARRALDLLLKDRDILENCARVGSGWGYWSTDYPAANFWLRKTKTGFSVSIGDGASSRPLAEGDETPGMNNNSPKQEG